MNILGAVREIIIADTAVQAAIGSNVFPITAPQTLEIPYVVMCVDSLSPDNTKCEPTDEKIRISVAAYGKTYDSAQSIHELTRAAIEGYNGSVTTTDDVLHNIKNIRLMDLRDEFEAEMRVFFRIAIYDVWYVRDALVPIIGNPFQTNLAAALAALPVFSGNDAARQALGTGKAFRHASESIDGLNGVIAITY